jgi:hypothetical protein
MNIFKKLKNIVGTISPLLGGALGGPLGGLAGKMIQDVLGVDSEKAALSILESDPNSLLKLKQVEADLEVKMKELGITEQQIHAGDRDSARDLAKDKGIVIQATLSAVYTVGYFGTLFMFIAGYAAVDPDYKGLVMTLLGALGGAQLQIMNFWFGSSSGSKAKTAIMANGSK